MDAPKKHPMLLLRAIPLDVLLHIATLNGSYDDFYHFARVCRATGQLVLRDFYHFKAKRRLHQIQIEKLLRLSGPLEAITDGSDPKEFNVDVCVNSITPAMRLDLLLEDPHFYGIVGKQPLRRDVRRAIEEGNIRYSIWFTPRTARFGVFSFRGRDLNGGLFLTPCLTYAQFLDKKATRVGVQPSPKKRIKR